MNEDNLNKAGKGELTQIKRDFDCQVHSSLRSLNQLMFTKCLIVLRILSVIPPKRYKHQEMFHKPRKSNILATEEALKREDYRMVIT